MRFGKKILTIFVLSIVTFSTFSANAQEPSLASGTKSMDSSPYRFGIEAAFMGQYFTIKGTEVKNNGLRPGFGINALAEYAITGDGSLWATVEPGLSFTSGRFYDKNHTPEFHTKKKLTNLNIPITAKYVVYDSAPVGFFAQAGIVPGFNLSQKAENLIAGQDKDKPYVPSQEKSFYLGAMIALGVNLNVLPTGSLQARVGWEPTFTNLANGTAKAKAKASITNPNATLSTDIKQNFLFFGVAYKF